MTELKTKKLTQRQIKQGLAKNISQEKPALLPKPIASVELVPLQLIDVLPQARTEFDEETIAELAADIQSHGLLQPVLLNPHLERFTLIAGERRLRACQLIGLASIPALITKASAEDAENMQLAENIQREQLGLEDLAKTVRRLFDRLGNLQAVANKVKKSKSWVCKHLALTCDNFSWRAQALLWDGISEDLELLTVLSKLDSINYQAADDLAKAIKAGKAGRKEAQTALKAAKDKQKATKLKNEAAEKKRQEKKAPQASASVEEPDDDVDEYLWELTDWIDNDSEEPPSLAEIIEAYPATILQEIEARLVAFWSAGAAMRDKGIQAATEFLFLSKYRGINQRFFHYDIERAAWLQGVAGEAFNWRTAIERARTITLQAWAEADAMEADSAQASA
jgi:ParB/RepB/Spo0J family partition protein